MIYLTNIDLNKNELQNAVVQPLAVAPSNPKLGQIYTDSASNKIKWYDGTAWKTIGVIVAESATNGNIVVDGVEMSVYELPIATDARLGGIRIGTGLKVDSATGVVSVSNEGMSVGSAEKLTHAREIALTGDAVGTVNFDGSQDVSITVDVAGLDNKVDKVDGKQLSTNDYTTAEKTKLGGIAAGAEANVNADWNAVSGDAQILNKPTALSEFTNDESFIDNTVANLVNYYTKAQTYTQTEVNNLIGQIHTISIEVVAELPATGESNIIYLVAKTASEDNNSYYEYVWVASTNKFEKIGDTEIDLSNYLQKNGDGSNVTVAFTQAGTRALPATGEAVATIIGKVAKYLADLKTVAFTGAYSDLTGKPTTIKSEIFTLATSSTSVSRTLTGTTVLGVMVTDSVTKEAVLCDVTVSGMQVTVTTAATPTNALQIVVSYM